MTRSALLAAALAGLVLAGCETASMSGGMDSGASTPSSASTSSQPSTSSSPPGSTSMGEPGATSGSSTTTPQASADIVETARQTGQFTALLAAADAAGLTAALKGPGPYTIFAPTDQAFRALPPQLLTQLQDPKNAGQLRAVLSYHVAPGAITSAQLASAGTTRQATLLGPTQTLDVVATGNAVTVQGANVVQADIRASNGVIHVIDKVLIPTAR